MKDDHTRLISIAMQSTVAAVCTEQTDTILEVGVS
jgi:hypothetical protein